MTLWYRSCQWICWNVGPAESTDQTFFLNQRNQGKEMSDPGAGGEVLEWEHVPVDTLWVFYVMSNLDLCVWEIWCCWPPENYCCNHCNFVSSSKVLPSLFHHCDAQSWDEEAVLGHVSSRYLCAWCVIKVKWQKKEERLKGELRGNAHVIHHAAFQHKESKNRYRRIFCVCFSSR